MLRKLVSLLAVAGLCAVAFAAPVWNPAVLPNNTPPALKGLAWPALLPQAPGMYPLAGANTFGRLPATPKAANRPEITPKKGGQSENWDPEMQVTSGGYYYTYYDNSKKCVTDSRGWIHTVFGDGSSIYYSRYRPGSGWTADTLLSSNYSYYPGIALDSNGTRIHICFMNYGYDSASYAYQTMYLKCNPTDSGNGGWDAAPTVLSAQKNGGSIYSWYPSIACSPAGQVHVCWWNYDYSGSGDAAGYAECSNGEWQPIVHVDSSDTNSYFKYFPCIASGRNHDLAIAWWGVGHGSDTSCLHIYCARRVGGVWQAVEQVDPAGFSFSQMYCCAAISPLTGDVHIAWTGYTPDWRLRIMHNWYCQDSTKWMNVDTITTDDGTYPYMPSICATPDGRVGVDWYEYNCDSSGGSQICYAERSADGVWSAPIIIGGSSTQEAFYPSIETDSAGGLYALWTQFENGYSDIYLRHCEPMLQRKIANLLDSKVTAARYHLCIGPNPSKGAIRVSYSLPEPGNVGVRLYDVNGALVTALAEGRREANVTNTVALDGSKLARGIYILKFTGETGSMTAKLVLE